jgi:hypothetical protein
MPVEAELADRSLRESEEPADYRGFLRHEALPGGLEPPAHGLRASSS